MLATTIRAGLLAMVLSGSAAAQVADRAIEWTRHVDQTFGFSVDLPLGLFEPLEQQDELGMTLAEAGGAGQLSIYGGPAAGLTLDGFAKRLASGEQVRTITYRTEGKSWFVLSGDYAPDSASGEPLIFYTKVLLSPDRQTFSAFELSYPKADKRRYDPIVERIEESLTRPRAGR